MKKQFKVIGIALGIVTALLLLKNNFACVLLRNAEYGMQRIIKEQEVDHLFIGSSVFRQGIDTKVLENNGFKNSFVLSYNGNQPFVEVLELKYLLENGVEIKHLYVDLYVNTINTEPWISDDKLLMDTDYLFKQELWDILKEYNEIDIIDSVHYWVTSNNELLLTWPIYFPIVNQSFYRGGSTRHSPGMKTDKTESVVVKTEKMNEVQLVAVKEIANLAKENNIQLTYLEVPQYYTTQTSQSYIDNIQKYVDFLEAENIEYILTKTTSEMIENRAVEMIDFDTRKLSNFTDSIHCSSEGRKLFTQNFCDGYLRL